MTDTMSAEPTQLDPISAGFRTAVSQVLTELVDAKQEELAALRTELVPLFDVARAYLDGGKRIRPAFAYWGWRAAGGSSAKAEQILAAGAAIELVHASALVHDDVMDDSATRRGGPSAHRALAHVCREDTPPDQAAQFGRSAAILLGDLLLAWSDEQLNRSPLKPKALKRGRVYFDKLRAEVIAGQYLDVLAQAGSSSTAADAMRVLRYKSAKYTVERPLQFGAAIADADDRLLRALSSYGVPLGEAFQLRDDVLGVFGEADVTGKPSGDDIREGKRTLLVARAFTKASAQQRAVLTDNLGNMAIDGEGIAAVQEVLRATGALADVETVITELTAASLSALRSAPVASSEVREALGVLADRVTQRAL